MKGINEVMVNIVVAFVMFVLVLPEVHAWLVAPSFMV
jgi:hypothetical protein